MSRILVISRLRVQNANAMSSPFTVGLPAITSWLGFGHALQRFLREQAVFKTLCISRVGFVLHDVDLQTYREENGFRTSVKLTANTAYLREQSSKASDRPPFVPEARCHLTASIALEIPEGDFANDEWTSELQRYVEHHLHARMRLAGGDIQSWSSVRLLSAKTEENFRELRGMLMPGFAVCDRRHLLQQQMKETPQDALDSVLNAVAIHHNPVQKEDGSVAWESKRLHPGWLIPIAIGFQGLTPLGPAKNTRDADTLHRFAESVISLGECVMPFRLKSIDEFLWEYHYDESNNLYLCTQRASQPLSE